MLPLGEPDRGVKLLGRRVECAAEQADPPQQGERVRLSLRSPDCELTGRAFEASFDDIVHV